MTREEMPWAESISAWYLMNEHSVGFSLKKDTLVGIIPLLSTSTRSRTYAGVNCKRGSA
jgi:hypothetical protein